MLCQSGILTTLAQRLSSNYLGGGGGGEGGEGVYNCPLCTMLVMHIWSIHKKGNL